MSGSLTYNVLIPSSVNPLFFGNPNRTITAINTSGGIVMPRTSGQVPFFVQVSASGITCTDSASSTSHPYQDLEYSWNFEDNLGIESFTPLTTGVATNPNTQQLGPEAAYVYRTAGTYNITLTIRGKNGSGFTTATVTQSVIATGFDTAGGEIWVDSVGGADGNPGTLLSPKKTINAINTGIAGNNKSVHIKKGSTFTGAIGIDFSNSNAAGIRIDTYGSGAKPVINLSSGGGNGLFIGPTFGQPNLNTNDVVISGITFTNSGSFNGGLIFYRQFGNTTTGAGKGVTFIFMDNCDFTSTLDINSAVTVQLADADAGAARNPFNNMGFWNCNASQPLTATNGQKDTYIGGPNSWLFWYGGNVSGAHNDSLRDHHMYVHTQFHVAFRYINFGKSDPTGTNGTGNFCLKASYDNTNSFPGAANGTTFFGQYYCFSECYFTGTPRARSLGVNNNDSTLARIKDCVDQFHSFANTNIIGSQFFMDAADSVTVRDCKSWASSGCWLTPGSSSGFIQLRVYRNKAYQTANDNNGTFFLEWQGSPPSWPYSEITDNIFEWTQSSAHGSAIDFASFHTGSSLIDRNQYYYPSTTNALYNNSTADSFATWQTAGWDVHGKVQNPNWNNPGSGDFS